MSIDQRVFKIKRGYRSRRAKNKNLRTTDHAQRKVYNWAANMCKRNKTGTRSVIDLGTGTGFKLIRYFGKCDTLGIDVEYRMQNLRGRYPERKWAAYDVMNPVPVVADLVLCVDVIEHVQDPRRLLDSIMAGTWDHCVISTPERDIVRGKKDKGPPKNRWHVREWNEAEFAAFLHDHTGLKVRTHVLGRYNLVAHLVRRWNKR